MFCVPSDNGGSLTLGGLPQPHPVDYFRPELVNLHSSEQHFEFDILSFVDLGFTFAIQFESIDLHIILFHPDSTTENYPLSYRFAINIPFRFKW